MNRQAYHCPKCGLVSLQADSCQRRSCSRAAAGSARLHLVLTYHWYDEIERGTKSIEYRAMTRQWASQIWQRRHEITHVRFARGYTSTMRTFEVEKIDIGGCPIDGWDEQYYRIHFKQNAHGD